MMESVCFSRSIFCPKAHSEEAQAKEIFDQARVLFTAA